MTKEQQARKKLIVALDDTAPHCPEGLVSALRDKVGMFKVGPERLLLEPRVITEIISYGQEWFLDLKLWDTPRTVLATTKWAANAAASMMTLGPIEDEVLIKDVVAKAASISGGKLKVLLTTVLTSSDMNIARLVSCANRALRTGCYGVVCSPWLSNIIKDMVSSQLITVCPAVRMDHNKHDHRSCYRPSEAMIIGADYIVVGRPISQSENPQATVEEIIQDMILGMK